MRLDSRKLLHEDLTGKVIGAFVEVYNELGQGFLEAVYRNSLAVALRQAGLDAVTELAVAVRFRGQTVGDYRVDILVNHSVIIELKTAAAIDPSHCAQILNYSSSNPV